MHDDDVRHRFEERTIPEPNTGCLLWTAGVDGCGYGQILINGKSHKTHRLAWEFKYGPVPTGMCVCHHCDTPPCVNVDHLFLGTHLDNMRDMYRKGRRTMPTGEALPFSKLTEVDVREIRRLFKTGASQSELARKYAVGISTIHSVVHRQTWKHVL